MAKNVALSNEAYSLLERLKRSGESFSDVVKRIGGKTPKPDWRESIGVWKDDKEMEKIYDRILKERHRISKRSRKVWQF